MRPADFHFRLPDWSPQRLIREAVVAHGFRHLGEEPIDPETAPWQVLRGIIFAALRHQHSNFDECLRRREGLDEAFRDEMANRIYRSACAKYPWLRNDDPRPFPEETDTTTKPLDRASRELADLHSLRDQLTSAIRDLRREGRVKDQKVLEEQLAETQGEIDALTRFFQVPKIIERENGEQASRILTLAHQEPGDYYFTGSRRFSPNHLTPLGFRCRECDAQAMRLKTPQDFGQGYRMVIFSCHCLSVAVVCPPAGRGRLAPLTRERWGELVLSSRPVDVEEAMP